MDLNSVHSIAEIAKDVATSIAILGGGIWALWKFVIRREAHPKIQFTLELNEIGRLSERIIVEVVAVIENKSVVRHKITDFHFSLRYLPGGAPVQEDEQLFNGQVVFLDVPPPKGSEPQGQRSLVKKSDEYSFVDPGVTQRYTYIASLPAETALAFVYAKFKYSDEASDYHSAQEAFVIRSNTRP